MISDRRTTVVVVGRGRLMMNDDNDMTSLQRPAPLVDFHLRAGPGWTIGRSFLSLYLPRVVH